jgi:N-methylhydantoinase A
MATRLAVDVGGTFSDLIFYDEASGRVAVAKGRRRRTRAWRA